MQQYRIVNNLIGLAVFLIAATTYILTMEPTASFWDCGEFIAVSYKLMVPHPPGAPLFLMIGRMFSLLAGDNKEMIAYYVNMISALSSAGTILFLYFSLVYLGIKLSKASIIGKLLGKGTKATTTIDEKEISLDSSQNWLIMIAAAIGSLAYTFSDSFWFSAVEAEVYAMSSLFTAIVFWATLKWDSIADEPGADRWLVFIAYMIGLSIGVHLLSLLVLPSLALIFYFRKFKQSTPLGTAIAFIAGFAGIFLIQSFVIPGLPSLAGSVEIFFVNTLGLPFNSGVLFFVIVLLSGLIYWYLQAIKKGQYYVHLGILSFFFILIGYLSFGVVLIRANQSPPINENNPDNVISFVSYLKREQYGDRPIVYGPQYNASPIKQEKGSPVYIKQGKKYVIAENRIQNIYSPKDKVFFPRLYSQQGGHFQEYRKWVKIPVDRESAPSASANWGFFFKYQLGHMYFRYLLWNFAGREGDVQDASWLQPFNSDEGIPDSITKNKARNQYFCIPLIIGLIGLIFQLFRDDKSFLVVASVFFTTGISLIIYANPPPAEPRERDYVFAGSTYAFSMWIGLGVIGLAIWLDELIKSKIPAIAASVVAGVLVPVLMARGAWDDHDRSNRFHSVDSARNLLASCEPNAIIFTGGDNDTFPCWYVQEVEGFRTDVRVCNLSLLGTDWYAAQMKKDAYDSKALPMLLDYTNFVQGKNDYIPIADPNNPTPGAMDLRTYISLVKRDDPQVRMMTSAQEQLTVLPTRRFNLNVDTAAVRNMNIIPADYKNNLQANMTWDCGKNNLLKSDLLMLDMIVTNNWKRPIYFASTLQNSNYIGLKNYMYLEGLAFRLLPAPHGNGQGVVNTDAMYTHMMKKFFFRGLDDSTRYFDENYRRFPLSLRNSFFRLAESLAAKGETEKSKEVIARCFKVMPDASLPYDPYTPRFIELMFKLGMAGEAEKVSTTMRKRSVSELEYYESRAKVDVGDTKQNDPSAVSIAANIYAGEIQNNLFILQELMLSYARANKEKESKDIEKDLQRFAYLLPPNSEGGEE